LRRQADLGHQDDRFLALAYDLFDGAQVNLRLAAAGDAVQQEGMEPTLLQRGFEFLPHLELIDVEFQRARVRRVVVAGVGKVFDAALDAASQCQSAEFWRAVQYASTIGRAVCGSADFFHPTGYLRGSADVISAQGEYVKTTQSAYLLNENVTSARIEKRRRACQPDIPDPQDFSLRRWGIIGLQTRYIG
jgi:hypothetical protein